MPKVTIEFNLPEDQEEFNTAIKAVPMSIALHEIHNHVFRPHRKHGYPDQDLQKLVDSNPEVVEAIGKLESMFWEILKDNEVEF